MKEELENYKKAHAAFKELSPDAKRLFATDVWNLTEILDEEEEPEEFKRITEKFNKKAQDLEAEIDWWSEGGREVGYSLAFNIKGTREEAVESIEKICKKARWTFEAHDWGVAVGTDEAGLCFDWEMIDQARTGGFTKS